MSIKEVLSAPASPWQRAYVERLIGSIRRDCLDHVIVLEERHLRRILKSYLAYYHRSRTHLGLAKDTPEPRAVPTRIILTHGAMKLYGHVIGASLHSCAMLPYLFNRFKLQNTSLLSQK